MSRKNTMQWVGLYGVILLMGFVACRQIYLAKRHNLSPWMGGGMGMFASVDRHDNRVISVRLILDDGRELPADILFHKSLERLDQRARKLPNEARLTALARRTAELRWTEDVEREAALANDKADSFVQVKAVRAECWRMVFHPDREVVERKLLARVNFPTTNLMEGAP